MDDVGNMAGVLSACVMDSEDGRAETGPFFTLSLRHLAWRFWNQV